MDKDEPSSGHQFYFSLTTDATNNHNFSLKDNKGKASLPASVEAASADSEGALAHSGMLMTDFFFFFDISVGTLIQGQ